MIAGGAFARGIGAYRMGLADSLSLARRYVEREFETLQERGFNVNMDELPIIRDKVTRGLSQAIQFDPIPKHWRILDVELSLPNAGNARIDVGADTGSELVIIDDKFKLRLDARYYDKTVSEYEHYPQMMHYTWGYGAFKQRIVERYYILLTVLEPTFSTRLHSFTVLPEDLRFFETTTPNAWADMERDGQAESLADLRVHVGPHRNQYGRCPMWNACFKYHLNPALMEAEYVQLPPGEWTREQSHALHSS